MGAILAVLAAVLGADVEIAADRMYEVNGQRTFILGLYELPKEDAALQQAAEAGINLMYTHSQEDLDRVWGHGVYAWANTGYDIDLSESEAARKESLQAKVKELAGHPAFLTWEVPDEALWNVWYIPQQWRFGAEARAHREKIETTADANAAGELNGMYRAIHDLYDTGQYAEGEAKADALSKQLGLPMAQPNQYLSTAPERMVTMAKGMKAGYEYLKSIDPTHTIWMNHAPRNSIEQLKLFGEAADAAGCDIYPMPDYKTGHSDLQDRSRVSVGDYTLRMQESVPGKPVFMVLQGFGWPDIQPEATEQEKKEVRRPNLNETRFMAYDSIVNGARGILYWGTAYIEKDSKLWEDVLATVKELSALQPILSAEEPDLDLQLTYEETWGSVDRDVKVLPKQTDDGLALIVVNEWRDARVCTIKGLPDGTYTDVHGGGNVEAKDGLTLHMPAYGVLVLRAN